MKVNKTKTILINLEREHNITQMERRVYNEVSHNKRKEGKGSFCVAY